MIEDKFKKLMIEHPGIIRAAVLSDQQISIVKLVARLQAENGSVLSPDIAAATGMTVYNASAQLRKLAAKGYLSRVQRASSTGGCEYVYRVITALENIN